MCGVLQENGRRVTSSHQSNRTETVTVLMIIEIKDETMVYKKLSFLLWNVGDQDRTRTFEMYGLVYVGDSDDRPKRLTVRHCVEKFQK